MIMIIQIGDDVEVRLNVLIVVCVIVLVDLDEVLYLMDLVKV